MPAIKDDLKDVEIEITQEFLDRIQKYGDNALMGSMNLNFLQVGQTHTAEEIMDTIELQNKDKAYANVKPEDSRYAQFQQHYAHNQALARIKNAIQKDIEEEAEFIQQGMQSSQNLNPNPNNPVTPPPGDSDTVKLKSAIDGKTTELISLKKKQKDHRKVKTSNIADSLLWAFICLFFTNSTKKELALRKEHAELQKEIEEMQRALKAAEDREKLRNDMIRNKFGEGGEISPHQGGAAMSPHQDANEANIAPHGGQSLEALKRQDEQGRAEFQANANYQMRVQQQDQHQDDDVQHAPLGGPRQGS